MDQRTARKPIAGPAVTFPEAAKVWSGAAALSFGGPAGQTALMRLMLLAQRLRAGLKQANSQ